MATVSLDLEAIEDIITFREQNAPPYKPHGNENCLLDADRRYPGLVRSLFAFRARECCLFPRRKDNLAQVGHGAAMVREFPIPSNLEKLQNAHEHALACYSYIQKVLCRTKDSPRRGDQELRWYECIVLPRGLSILFASLCERARIVLKHDANDLVRLRSSIA